MAIIPKQPISEYRGRISRCGICGWESNLWATNSKHLEGRLVCPVWREFPDEHNNLTKIQELLYTAIDNEDYLQAEKTVLRMLKLKAKFKSICSDVMPVAIQP